MGDIREAGELSDRDPRSDFLFARPSVLEGVARLMDLQGSLNKYNRTREPDEIALAMDWKVIARDLNEALVRIVRQRTGGEVVSSRS